MPLKACPSKAAPPLLPYEARSPFGTASLSARLAGAGYCSGSQRMLEQAPPKVFTTAAVFKLHGFNILLGIPVFLSLLLVSLIRLQFISFVIPLIALTATVYFLPLGLGNPYVARLARLLRVEARPDALLVQLTLFPRIRSGLRAVVEDADDIGFVRFTETELVFEGDSLRLVLPYEQIAEVHPHNVGLR